MVLLDITKAFDRVWHKGLLFKLENIGIKGPLLLWLKSYLSNRNQRVVMENKISNLCEILAGVPQGSILGPLLFLVFINDIDQGIHSDISLFADDTALIHSFSHVKISEISINEDLNILSKWSESWMIKFNPTKTKFMLFSNKKKNKSQLHLFLNKIPLEQVKCSKHLGIHFTDDLRWSDHIDKIVKKANSKIGCLYRSKEKFLRRDKINIYCSIIRPALEYGSVIYDNCSLLDSNKIEGVQKFAARVCTGALKRTEYIKLQNELGWISLKSRRRIYKGILTYKILNNLTPTFLKTNFKFQNILIRTLRTTNRLIQPKCRLNSYSSSLFPSQTTFWNNLPNNLNEYQTVSSFRKFLQSQYDDVLEVSSDCASFMSCNGYYGKILTQIRLGLSPLKFIFLGINFLIILFARLVTMNPKQSAIISCFALVMMHLEQFCLKKCLC